MGKVPKEDKTYKLVIYFDVNGVKTASSSLARLMDAKNPEAQINVNTNVMKNFQRIFFFRLFSTNFFSTSFDKFFVF